MHEHAYRTPWLYIARTIINERISPENLANLVDALRLEHAHELADDLLRLYQRELDERPTAR